MIDPYLTIYSPTLGEQSLNEVFDLGHGMQAQPGATGLGLPSVEVQFDESAGEGAKYLGHRAKQRDIDIPIHVIMPDRDGLKSKLHTLSRYMAEPFELRWIEGNEVWVTQVVQSGGGDYAYGTDTDGQAECVFILTLRSESPFWSQIEEQQVASVTASGEALSVDILNVGSTPAAPRFEISGVCDYFTIYSPDGSDAIVFREAVRSGESVVIDMGKGTVVDQDGNSRYSALAEAPGFFKVPSGPSDVNVYLASTSAPNAVITNHATNPTFKAGTAGWAYFSESFGFGGIWSFNTGAGVATMSTGVVTTGVLTMSNTISGLVVGQRYYASADISAAYTLDQNVVRPPAFSVKTAGGVVAATTPLVMKVDGVTDRRRVDVRAKVSFIATETSMVVEFDPGHALQHNSYWMIAPAVSFSKVLVSETAGPFFHGATATDGLLTYSWAGATNTSKSLATPVNYLNKRVDVHMVARKHLVI